MYKVNCCEKSPLQNCRINMSQKIHLNKVVFTPYPLIPYPLPLKPRNRPAKQARKSCTLLLWPWILQIHLYDHQIKVLLFHALPKMLTGRSGIILQWSMLHLKLGYQYTSYDHSLVYHFLYFVFASSNIWSYTNNVIEILKTIKQFPRELQWETMHKVYSLYICSHTNILCNKILLASIFRQISAQPLNQFYNTAG